MKRTGLMVASILVLGGCNAEGGKVSLDSDVNKASYAIGYKTGEQMKGRMDDLDLDAFITGMRHGARGKEDAMLLTAEEMDSAIVAYQKKKYEEMEARMQKESEENQATGETFRKENAAREGVTTTESGLQYEELAAGDADAPSPGPEDTVVAHYHGTLIDGTVFDSSVERGEPATFPLDRVIPGWQEALTKMNVGDKWRIVVPPELAYGESGVGEKIGPNSTLVFEVELLDVTKNAEGGNADGG